MGLLKTKIALGIPCEYWKILHVSSDVMHETTAITLGLYCNYSARTNNINNVIAYETINVNALDLTREQAYALVVKSRPGLEFSESGSEITTEKNWFADSIPVLERGQKIKKDKEPKVRKAVVSKSKKTKKIT